MKPLTIRQAWAKIAAAYEAKIVNGGTSIYLPDDSFLANAGLCFAVNKLRGKDQITDRQRETMCEQLDGALEDSEMSELNDQADLPNRRGNYLADYSLEGDAFRAVLAQSFAEVSR